MLGNIVAVTSIIAVVSLIQGMNAYVTDAIVSDVGADNFTIQRMPVVRSADDEERVRNNPRITLDEADAVRKFSDNIDAVAAQASAAARIAYGERGARRRPDPGRVARLRLLLDLRRRARPADQPGRGRRAAGRSTVLGWRRRRPAVRRRSTRSTRSITIGGQHFRVVGVSEKKGSVFGNSQDEFAIIPLGAFQKMFGARPACS